MFVLGEFKVITEINIIDAKDKSYMISSSSVVTHIGNGFLKLTGYSSVIMGKCTWIRRQ